MSLTDGQKKKDIRAILILGLWKLWKHRNAIVFDGVSPSLRQVMCRIESEGRVWRMTGLLKDDLEVFFGRMHVWVADE